MSRYRYWGHNSNKATMVPPSWTFKILRFVKRKLQLKNDAFHQKYEGAMPRKEEEVPKSDSEGVKRFHRRGILKIESQRIKSYHRMDRVYAHARTCSCI